MWRLQKYKKNQVIISLCGNRAVCAWIQPARGNKPSHLKAYQRTPFFWHELDNGIIYNQQAVAQVIADFFKQHQIKKSSIILAIESSALVERIVTQTSASPSPRSFIIPKLKTMIWDFKYLYPHDDGTFSFYLAGISRELLFSYQLLAHRAGITPTVITTCRSGIFHVYKHYYGAAFRQTQFAHDMLRTQHQLEDLITPDLLARMISIDSKLSLNIRKEAPYLRPLIGLAQATNHKKLKLITFIDPPKQHISWLKKYKYLMLGSIILITIITWYFWNSFVSFFYIMWSHFTH